MRAPHPHATGLLLPRANLKQKTWQDYHDLMGDRVEWMLANSDQPEEDFHLAADALEPLFGERPWNPKELLDTIRWDLLQTRLVLLGVDFPTTGRLTNRSG